MRIHNYYSDILSRLYMFLNDSVFSPTTKIKRIQYNLGSASSIIQYSDHYDLPSMVIKLGEIAPWQQVPQSPATYQMRNRFGFNPYKGLAVSNQTKGIDLELQLQYFTLNAEITINCESQMQALNLAHDITLRVPVDRLLNQFTFVSFIELDDRYMSPTIMDIQNDDIFNLFINRDSVDSSLSYSFSFEFDPLVRLTGTPQLSLDDLTKGSYQVTCSFELNTKVPMYLVSPELPMTDQQMDTKMMDGLRSTSIGRVPGSIINVPVYSDFIYYVAKEGNSRELISIRPTAIDPVTSILNYNGALYDGRTYSITADYIGSNVQFNYSITYKGSDLNGSGILFKYANSVSVCRLNGDIVGNILDAVTVNVNGTPSTISGLVLANVAGVLIDSSQLTFDIGWSRSRPTLMNSKSTGTFVLSQPGIGDIYSIASNINAYRTTLDTTLTTIHGFDIYNPTADTITKLTLSTPFTLLPDGSFSVSITNPLSIQLSGVFNKSTGQLTSHASSLTQYEILSISIKPMWNYLPYGGSQMDSITMDIGGISNTSIPSRESHDAFIDKVANLDTSYVAIFSTLPYIQQNAQFTFAITLDPKILTLNPIDINTSFEVYFVHDKRYFSSTTTTDFMIDLTKSIPTELVFKATEYFRLNVLDRISKYMPFYFGIISI